MVKHSLTEVQEVTPGELLSNAKRLIRSHGDETGLLIGHEARQRCQ